MSARNSALLARRHDALRLVAYVTGADCAARVEARADKVDCDLADLGFFGAPANDTDEEEE